MGLIFIAILSIVIFIHFCYYIGVFGLFVFRKKEKSNPNSVKEPVSILVCAKNEAENLQKFLPLILNQQYPTFEVVVINDRSYDDTENVLEQFSAQYKHLKVVNVIDSEYFHGNKKFALTMGIKAAKYNNLLFTDADCFPNSDKWLALMTERLIAKEIVLGYSPYETQKSLLNKIIRFETLMTALQYFAYAKLGLPYMGVGRNLMYTKELFLKNKGFNQHIHLLSGDDDLFVNRVATRKNVAIMSLKDAFVTTIPKTTFKNWLQQKKRHISTATHYKWSHKLLLGLFALNRFLFWAVLPVVILTNLNNLIFLEIIAGLVFFKILIEYLIIGKAAKKLKEKKILLWSPFLDLLLLLLQLYIFIFNLLKKPKHW